MIDIRSNNWYEEKILKTANTIILRIGRKQFDAGYLNFAIVLAKELDIKKSENYQYKIYMKLIEDFFCEVLEEGQTFDPYSKQHEIRMNEKYWTVLKYLQENQNFRLVAANMYRNIGFILGFSISLLLYLFSSAKFIYLLVIFCCFVILGLVIDRIREHYLPVSYNALHFLEN